MATAINCNTAKVNRLNKLYINYSNIYSEIHIFGKADLSGFATALLVLIL